jgi:hypothetical protein
MQYDPDALTAVGSSDHQSGRNWRINLHQLALHLVGVCVANTAAAVQSVPIHSRSAVVRKAPLESPAPSPRSAIPARALTQPLRGASGHQKSLGFTPRRRDLFHLIFSRATRQGDLHAKRSSFGCAKTPKFVFAFASLPSGIKATVGRLDPLTNIVYLGRLDPAATFNHRRVM